MATAPVVNRRDFLKKRAAGSAALVIGFHLSPRAFGDQAKDQEEKTPNPFDAWVRITPDNRVTLVLGKSEMGQGVYTSLPMILAEELCADWKQVRVEQAPTNPKIYDLGTGGSGSVEGSWLPLRQAGAAARELLIAAAAKKWEVGADTCKAKNGYVVHGHPERSFRFGELVAEASKLPIPDLHKVPLKNPSDFVIAGREVLRLDAAAKSTGSAKFGIDSRVPGMLYAVIARCPVFEGKVASFDATKAKAVPGVRDVFEIKTSGRGASTTGGVAVLADNSWAAIQGRKALAVNWDEGPAANESSDELRKQFLENAAKPGKNVLRNDGDADAALSASAKKVEAIYELPFAAHVCMEPMNCTVHIGPDSAEAWVPSQGPQWAQAVIAEIAKLPPEKVVVHTTLMGGGFGRRYHADFVMEAAQVAKISSNPVMVLWTREDDMQHDFYRPASYHRLQGAQFGEGREDYHPLDTARLKGVLRLAAEKAGWDKPLPQAQGRGIAAFYSFFSYVAAVAEVAAHPSSFKVKRLVCAVDCGRVVNPNGVRAQVESAAIYALAATVKDAITVDRGRVVQANFNDYEMIRMNEAPPIDVYLVPSSEDPSGIGEPTVPVIAPALCNAISNATGKRLRRLPIRGEDLG